MLRIAICEDDQFQQELLVNYIEKLNVIDDYEISKYSSGEELVDAYKNDARFSIILLDMQMAELDGIQTAEIIRKYDRKCLIIIITSIMEYAVEGYSVDAYDFILKPVNRTKFNKVFTRAIKEIQSTISKTYTIKTRGKTSVLRLSEIIYFESDKKRVIVHTYDDSQSSSESISIVEKQLESNGFVRVSRFYLVNVSHIKQVGVKNILLSTGQELIYSDKYRENVKSRYMSFVMGEM